MTGLPLFAVDIPPIPYVDPWCSSFEERLRALTKGSQRVAYYYEDPDNSTFRYRVYNMIQALGLSRQGTSAGYFHQGDLGSLGKVIDLCDVLVVCRSRYRHELNQAITRARSRGKPVFFDIDDMVFDADYAHLVVHTLDQDLNHPDVWDYWFAYMGRIGATMRLCDETITTNDYLAAQIRNFTERPVSIIPNFLNREQMEISRRIFEMKRSQGFERNHEFHLGYFSGTPTHNKDFAIISDALLELLSENPHIIIRIVGFMDIEGPLQRFSSRIERYPLQDFVNLQRLIGEVEINLMPLQDNEFSNCKSELKYYEAGIVGTLSIASPVHNYVKAIRDGDNGYLASAHEWYKKLVEVTYEMDSYPMMAQKARMDCEEKYAWYNQTDLIERILFC